MLLGYSASDVGAAGVVAGLRVDRRVDGTRAGSPERQDTRRSPSPRRTHPPSGRRRRRPTTASTRAVVVGSAAARQVAGSASREPDVAWHGAMPAPGARDGPRARAAAKRATVSADTSVTALIDDQDLGRPRPALRQGAEAPLEQTPPCRCVGTITLTGTCSAVNVPSGGLLRSRVRRPPPPRPMSSSPPLPGHGRRAARACAGSRTQLLDRVRQCLRTRGDEEPAPCSSSCCSRTAGMS